MRASDACLPRDYLLFKLLPLLLNYFSPASLNFGLIVVFLLLLRVRDSIRKISFVEVFVTQPIMAPRESVYEYWSAFGSKVQRQVKGLNNPFFHPFLFLFQIFQWFADLIFSPTPPGPSTQLGRPKVAVIGAGITGVTSAAHCIGHGFDVVLFEAGDKKNLGGIWSVCDSTPHQRITIEIGMC